MFLFDNEETTNNQSGSNNSGVSVSGGILQNTSSGDYGVDNQNVNQTTSVSSNNFIIEFKNSLIVKKGNKIISQSENYQINLNSPGLYIFNCLNNFLVNKELKINIETNGVVVDGNNIIINLNKDKNKTGVFKNGTSQKDGYNDVILKNINFIYRETQFGGFNLGLNYNNPPNGGGGICMNYFGKNAKKI